MFNKKLFKAFLIMFLLVVFLAGCTKQSITRKPITGSGPGSGNDKISEPTDPASPQTVKEILASQSKIKKFASYEDLAEFLENNVAGPGYGFNNYATRGGVMMEGGMALDSVAEMGAPMTESKSVGVTSPLGGGGSDDFSKTNVQVEGVDEADIIKTDGKYIYALVKNTLYVATAYPATEAKILKAIEFTSRPQDVYINGDYLAVFGHDTNIWTEEKYKRFKRRGNYTFLKVFDISDRSDPRLVRDVNLEGSYTNSRMIGDYVYFMTTAYNIYHIDGEPIIPRILENGIELPSKCADGVRCFAPEVYYFDMPYQNYNYTTITAVNLKNSEETISGEVYLLSGSQNMYVSLDNIYITYTKYISEYQLEMEVMKELLFPRLSGRDQERIQKIDAVDNFILNRQEKQNKISRIIEGGNNQQSVQQFPRR